MLRTSAQLLKNLMVLLIPLVIVLGSVRLVATEAYLSFEYGRTDFSEDPFGFDHTQRLAFASANLQFVTQNQSLADLAGQSQNGIPLYTIQELKHMQDVQNIYQAAWRIWQFALILTVFSGLALAWRKEDRASIVVALQKGGLFTVGLVFVVGLVAIVAWQAWFIIFHQIFFAAGNWTFDFSATLIRLFPEKFWFDVALTVSTLSLIVGILVYWIGSRLLIINSGQPGRNEPAWQRQTDTSQL
jgi:integral membrane protein (TIGR01906 family)